MAPIALGRSAATAIAIDDSDDDQSAPPAPEAIVLIVSSDDEDDVDSSSVRSVKVLGVSAWGGSEATGRRKRKAPPRPRAPSAVPSVVVPVVSAPAASADGLDDDVVIVSAPAASAKGRDTAASRRNKSNKEPRRPRSPAPSFVSLGSPPVVDSSAAVSSAAADPAPSANGGTHEATSRQKRTQTRWCEQDELTLLATMAEIRGENDGVLETGSVLLQRLLYDGKILRSDLRDTELSYKVSHLRNKFIDAVAANYGGSGIVGGERNYRSPYQYHNHLLYEKSKEVWPELLRDGGATTSSQQPSSSSNHFI